MKKFRFLLALLIVLAMSSGAFAATDLFHIKNSTGDTIKINSTGIFSGYRTSTEVATTNDTVTTGESKKTFLANISDGSITFTLPVAREGIEYTFVAISGSAASDTGDVYLAPQPTGIFVACVSSDSTSTFAVGDRLKSTATTGDTVKIVGGDSDTWYCVNRINTWTDAN